MDIQKIKKLYDQNQNLTEYFKTSQNKNNLNLQEIELIYDLQSGNYINNYENNKSLKEYKDKFTDEIVNYINNLNFKFDSILEAGIGEGTTFVNVIQKLNNPKLKSFGLDISWSRLAYANKFLKKNSIKNTKLVTGLLENLPFLENSIDIVYTAHSIEPNRDKEKEILKELFRVTKNYLILLEPSYEFGNNEQKERMDRLSYAKNLNIYCKELGYKIIKHKLLENHSVENNKTEIIIIEKSTKKINSKDFLACPESKTKLFKSKNFYYSAESFYSYPILENIACLNSENKILSTKVEDFIKLDKTHPRYNETMFLRSLKEPINEEKIKDMYCPNAIGFLATEENLMDKEFMDYIMELTIKFPQIEVKGFYFNKIEHKEFKNIKFIVTDNIKNIIQESEFFISNHISTGKRLDTYLKLVYASEAIYTTVYDKNKKSENINMHNNQNHIIIKNYEFFGYSKEEVELMDSNVPKLFIYSIFKKLGKKDIDFSTLNMYEFLHFTIIEIILKMPTLKKFFYERHKKGRLLSQHSLPMNKQ